MFEDVEKSLGYGGLLISLGVGGLAGDLYGRDFGFWCGVICAGVLLFGVALLVTVVGLVGQRGAGNRTDQTDRTDLIRGGTS